MMCTIQTWGVTVNVKMMVNHLIWHISSMFMGGFTTKNRVEDLKEIRFKCLFTNVGIQTKQTAYILTSNALKVR